MKPFPADGDRKQYRKDNFLCPNRYRLDDRFVLRDGARHPVAVICPGGAYQRVSSYIEGVPFARQLNSMGISAYIVYYRVKEKGRYPAPQEDLARAVREVLDRSERDNTDAERYSVWGSSAGGHLAASFGTGNMGYPLYGLPRPAALVLAYPVITMEPPLTHPQSHDTLLGPDPGEELERFASVERHVTADYPPTFLWCGDKDGTVPPENTLRMEAALRAANVRHICQIAPGVDHGVGPGTGSAAAGWIRRAAAFWLEGTDAAPEESRETV